MSQDDTKRFFNDMASNADLKAGAEKAGGIEDIAKFANDNGYSVTADDLKAVATQNKDLTDEQLEAIAGGFSADIGISIGCVICVSAS